MTVALLGSTSLNVKRTLALKSAAWTVLHMVTSAVPPTHKADLEVDLTAPTRFFPMDTRTFPVRSWPHPQQGDLLSAEEWRILDAQARADRIRLSAQKVLVEPKFALAVDGRGEWVAYPGDWADSRAARRTWASWSPERRTSAFEASQHSVVPLTRMSGVDVVVVTCDGYMLCTRRAKGAGSYPGSWAVSVGETFTSVDVAAGALDAHHAVRRGVREELGVNALEVQILGVVVTKQMPQCGLAAIAWVKEDASALLAAASAAAGADERMGTALLPTQIAWMHDVQAQTSSNWVPWCEIVMTAALAVLHP